jgi:hypothetical protein
VRPLQGYKALIWQHLEKHRSITALEALGVYRCYGLHQRISELRKMGYPIESKIKRDATGKPYAFYEYLPE